MKVAKTMMLLVAAALFVIGMGGTSYAFHSGGVAECEGCHTMHNSLDGATETIGGGTVGVAKPFLLKGSDQSSTCLNCHAQPDAAPSSYHILTLPFAQATLPVEMTPGGDFTWLAKDFTWVPRAGSATEESFGYQHGHNVYAGDFGLGGDGRLSQAPGGTYTAGPNFGCQSCHDPHGKLRKLDTTDNFSTTGKPIRTSGSYGNESGVGVVFSNMAVGAYRILGGIGYVPKSYVGGPAFTQNPMIAAVNSSYNRTENATSTRVAYGKRSSEWCANCHNAMHSGVSTVPGALVHPTGETLGSEIAGNYNAYKKSGDLTGSSTNSYTSLVPFQNDNYDSNNTLSSFRSSIVGPGSSDRVVCQSCHRSHASAFNSMLRWSYGNEFMTVADSAGAAAYPDPTANPAQAQGKTTAETQRAYYERPASTFAPYQRVLCNKCHAKD